MSNFEKIQKSNDGSFKVYKNDIVFFIDKAGNTKGGCIVSYIQKASGSKECSFINPKFPILSEYQPKSFCKVDKKTGEHGGAKYVGIGSSKGIIKLKVDILGNIESYQVLGNAKSKLLDEIKSIVSH